MSEAESNPEPKAAPRLGSYTLVQALGSGGMSNVFRAIHEESGNVVAVKVLPRTLAKNATLLQRFMREAKSAEALDHSNIVAIYDRGFDQGRHYLVLEYVEGRDLHDRVRINGPLGVDEAVRFIREVAEGLRYAAGQGMIHRDIKPANLLMTPDGHAKIIDLGLALLLEDEDERVTRDGTTVGTVDYMAPEQARDSRQTSERSDIYSLGCTFYYLLTGSQPYPGGSLSDKLAKHYKAPIPDPREHRPDVSESLSLLIRRMMEKKPERRFADYDHLIEALDSLDDPSTQELHEMPLDALIVDDDDDDDDEIGLAPTESAIARTRDVRSSSSQDQILMAEIVDDDDEEPTPTLPPPGLRPRKPDSPKRPRPEPISGPAELTLSELAALGSDDSVATRRTPSKSTPPAASRPTNRPVSPSASFAAITDDDDDEEVYGSPGPVRRSAGSEISLKTWIGAAVLVGLSIAILGFGTSMIVSLMKPEPPVEPIKDRTEEVANESTSSPVPIFRSPRGPIAPKKNPVDKKAETPPPPVVASVAAPVEEATYPAEWESRLAPGASVKPAPLVDPKAKTVVRRVTQSGDEPQVSTIAGAFSKANDLVEIADVGPFFEDDCQVAGKSRLIRARSGIRPMIKVEFAENEVVKEQAAKFILGGSRVDHLVFEGIDFAVDVRDLPVHQSTLFLCQGADLTFRDCSITVLNANDSTRTSRFSIFRVEEGTKPNRIVLERTLIRGPVGTLVDIAAARAEVVLSRSLILGDTSPLFDAQTVEKPTRSFHFYRSFLVTRGHVLEFANRANPLTVRSIGTTFARVEATNGQSASLFHARTAFTGEPSSVLDWSGEDNEFIGWPAWLTSGTDASTRLADLDAVRASWPGSDGSSRDATSPWLSPSNPDAITPEELAYMVPIRRPTLVKIATPSPRLRDLTMGSIGRLPTPALSESLIPSILPQVMRSGGPGGVTPPAPQVSSVFPKSGLVPPPEPIGTPSKSKSGPTPKKGSPMLSAGPVMKGANQPPAPPGPLNLTFDVNEAPWFGDLGLYLGEKLVPGTPRATVTVKGVGTHYTSPIRFAAGLSIALLGENTQGLPTFVPRPGSAGRVMFEIQGGDLTIAHLGFAADGANRPRHWVLSEEGILAIKHCRFRETAPAGSSGDSGPLIAFQAREIKPMIPRMGPLVKETDRPTARLKDCLIWTSGEAISAEVGRGVVDLENCLIISGGPAITLRPVDVPRSRFEADLILDRCTIATDKSSILLAPMGGAPTGPTRPWLISSRRCAFPRTQPPGGAGALLQVDPDAMTRGVLFWQSSFDAYDSLRLLAATGPQPSNAPSSDVKKQWIDLWGAEHSKGDQGPTARQNQTVLRYKDRDKPKPGKIVPASVEVDKEITDYGADYKDLPPAPRAVVETPPTRKAPVEAPVGKGAFGPKQAP